MPHLWLLLKNYGGLTKPKPRDTFARTRTSKKFWEKNVPFQRIITLTTDFGLTEHYVGAMKGVIYSINPTAQLVDITNAVQSFDVLDGALAISQAYSYFPKDTVHIVVVDPGVGGTRRPIIANIGQYVICCARQRRALSGL